MYRHLLILPLLIAFAAPAAAQDHSDCGGTNAEAMECIIVAYEKADDALTVVWEKVLASVRQEGFMSADEVRLWREDLTAAQSAWLTFRDTDCDAVSFEWYGGTGANMAMVVCRYDHTVARTRDLEDRYLNR